MQLKCKFTSPGFISVAVTIRLTESNIWEKRVWLTVPSISPSLKQELETMVTPHAQSGAERKTNTPMLFACCLLSASLHLSYTFQCPALEMVLPTFRVGLPISVDNLPEICTQANPGHPNWGNSSIETPFSDGLLAAACWHLKTNHHNYLG